MMIFFCKTIFVIHLQARGYFDKSHAVKSLERLNEFNDQTFRSCWALEKEILVL